MRGILITSSILIVLIAALRPLLRGKIDPRAQYALWLLVAVRLLLPVNLFTSAYSALALLDRAEQPPQIVQTVGQTAIPVRSYDDARAEVIEDYRRQGGREADLTPADLSDIDAQARQLMRGPTLAQLAEKYAKAVWLAGAAIMAAWFIMVNLGLRRRLRGAKRLDGVTCLLPVYVSDALPSPCLCGTVRPRIYVTPAALESPERLRHVLAHELTHHRQKDHWWALVRCACLCLYWFDPLVWWAAALSRQDCELACDAGAIRRLGEEERIPYGRTLVDMIAAGRCSLLQTATTMTGGKRRVRERVRLIARKPKTVIAVALALILVLGAAVGCTFTGAPEGE
ncbi:MAG: M56 family metallopeptidase, partial [Oscillospiraceae bacterium]|nr:M56 family metallopeptidase [Oscillospiraceae bacterium]